MKKWEVKLKPLDECFEGCIVEENSPNYWKIISGHGTANSQQQFKSQIGFKVFYKKYFGSDKTFIVTEHPKYSNVLYLHIGLNVRRMIFRHWVEPIRRIEEPPKELPVILNGLIAKWEDLF